MYKTFIYSFIHRVAVQKFNDFGQWQWTSAVSGLTVDSANAQKRINMLNYLTSVCIYMHTLSLNCYVYDRAPGRKEKKRKGEARKKERVIRSAIRRGKDLTLLFRKRMLITCFLNKIYSYRRSTSPSM
jgi:hypothetical protein